MVRTIKNYCSRCKTKKDLMPKPYSWGSKGIVGYRLCNTCNTKRQRDYYATDAGQANVYAVTKRQYVKNKKHVLARQKVKLALKKGELVKPTNCEWCGEDKPLDGHHDSYDKPLVVLWICRQCHAKLHRDLKHSV